MSEPPELFGRPQKARSLAFLFVAGALVGALTLVLPHDEAVMDAQVWGLVVAAITFAVPMFLAAERMSEPLLHAMLVVGTVILSLATYWTGTSGYYPIIYSWAILFAFYFFPLRVALIYLALAGAMYIVVLAVQDAPSAVVRWVLAMGTPALAGLVISRMLDRVRRETARSTEHARVLRETEARARMIVEAAPDAFVAVDGEGLVVRWNKAAEGMFKWTADEVLGRPLGEIIYDPEQREAYEERRQQIFGSGDDVAAIKTEVEPRRKDGKHFPAEITISRLQVDDGYLFTAFYRDLSEQRRREKEREAFYDEQSKRKAAERSAGVYRRLQALSDLAIIHSKPGEMLEGLIPGICEALSAQAATIFLTEEGENGKELVVRASSAAIPEEAPRVAWGAGVAGRIAAERRPLLIKEPSPRELVDPVLRQGSFDSLAGVPLIVRGEVIGVIQVAAAAPSSFTDDDVNVLGLAADRVATAFDQAQVAERSHHIAETLQRSLLPQNLPQPPGLVVDARYRAAAKEAEVGGDWYDVISIAGGGVGLVMGDVAGKGLAAASMVGRLRSATRAYALEGHAPADVVERLNRLVWTELEESQMATLLYLVFDPDGGVRWVNAGHLPPLLVVGEGLAHFLEGPRSVPLGVLPFPSFEENSVTLEPGATVLLYTDGLIERPGDHLDRGLAALAEAVRRAPPDPSELCDHVLAELVPAAGAADDVALLAMRHAPLTERFELVLRPAPEELAPLRGHLRRWLLHFDGTPTEIAEVTTALGEACANAIEHAGASGRAPFEVAGRLDGRQVDLTIRDRGTWRPERPDDQGRGLTLMRALMDSVEITPGPEGTTVHMTRVLNGNEAP